MKDFFKQYSNMVMASLGILMILIVIGCAAFAIETTLANLNTAIGSGPAQTKIATGFDLNGAKALDLKGLVQ